jgi:hypothetical protein
MPLAFIVIGVVLLTAGVRGKQDELFALLRDDFTGQQNFLIWLAALGAVGAVGYIPGVAPVSRAMLVLILIVLILSNRGFFSQFRNAVLSTQAA